ncbi:fibronectin type III domain-containing protein, partial [Aquiflexum sp. TKW24L]|uniref:fibronectin type III domain-containing protein n=1 Tax=Aquiflexum sp. TKW24L TaxID=2942212 RepID=UPI0020BFC1B4
VDQNVGASLSYNPTGLEIGTTYFWRVRAYNPEGNSEWSEVRNFSKIPTPSLSLGMVGHWQMEEGGGNTLIDGSGNNNNGVLQNTSNVTWIDGVIGLALHL